MLLLLLLLYVQQEQDDEQLSHMAIADAPLLLPTSSFVVVNVVDARAFLLPPPFSLARGIFDDETLFLFLLFIGCDDCYAESLPVLRSLSI